MTETIKVFVWDTETTGLYNKKERDISKQPYVVQFAGALVDMDTEGNYKVIKEVDILIKPPVSIPFVTSQIHGIYDIDVVDRGDFSFYVDVIQALLNKSDIIVGHNIEFDENVIRTEFERLKLKGEPYDYTPQKVICTMNEGTDWCKLPKKNSKSKGYKRPKLQELCKKAIGRNFYGAHNAMVDVNFTLMAFSVMVKEGVIKLKKNEELTLF